MELLVTIVIMGTIVGAVAASVISILHNSNTTTQRLSQSHDAQMATAFFANDVQSADVSGTVSNVFYETRACDTSKTAIFSLAWTTNDSSNNPVTYTVVSYSYVAQAGGPPTLYTLYRLVCLGTGSQPYHSLNQTPISTVVIASNLVSAPSPVVASCVSGTPKTISMSLTETATPAGNYSFQVGGTRREATC